MQDFIQFLRQQLVLCLRLLDLANQQKDALVHMSAQDVQRLTKEIEAVIIDLNLLGQKRQRFLQQHGAPNDAAWLAAQADGAEKHMAQKLLDKIQGALAQLKAASGDNRQYLEKNMSYIDYNVNILTGAAAGVTYNAAEAGGIGTVTGTKMFEANI